MAADQGHHVRPRMVLPFRRALEAILPARQADLLASHVRSRAARISCGASAWGNPNKQPARQRGRCSWPGTARPLPPRARTPAPPPGRSAPAHHGEEGLQRDTQKRPDRDGLRRPRHGTLSDAPGAIEEATIGRGSNSSLRGDRVSLGSITGDRRVGQVASSMQTAGSD